MKTLFFLLLPLISFAQSQLPDTLFIVDGRTVPCLITSIDDSRVYFDYSQNRSESFVLKALDHILLENFGIIYKMDSGFLQNEDDILAFVENRIDKLREEQIIKEELNRVSFAPVKEEKTEPDHTTPAIKYKPVIKNKDYKKWSFGVLYVPYYSGSIYSVVSHSSNSLYYDIYEYSVNQINMEAQLGYALTPLIRLTFDAGYSSSFSETSSEYHHRAQNNNEDRGEINTFGLKTFDFNLGIKYYFKNLLSEKVSVYTALSMGKQIAFVQDKNEILFQDTPPNYTTEDNAEKFSEELNSPWHFNIGFGAEYFFNESLSLTSNIRVLYSTVSGKYNSRYISENITTTQTQEIKKHNFITRIGLGLNFYF